MSFTRVFSYPRLRNSFTAVSTICWRSRAFLRSRSPAVSPCLVVPAGPEKSRFTICSRFLVSRSGADIGTLSAVLGRAMVHPNPGMLAVLPSLSADAAQSVRDYNIRATNVKVRGSGAVSSDRPAWLVGGGLYPGSPQERDPAEYGRARQVLTLAGNYWLWCRFRRLLIGVAGVLRCEPGRVFPTRR